MRSWPSRRKRNQSDEASIQITSMADIFTILLVFLLKSFSASAISLTPSSNLTLPTANADSLSTEATKVEVSSFGIKVGEKLVLDGKFLADEKGLFFPEVKKELDRVKEKQRLISSQNSDVKNSKEVIILSDKRVPFSIMKKVVVAVSASGFSEIKFAIAKNE